MAAIISSDQAADFEIYGSLSSIIVLLLCLYVSALVLVVGAEFIVVRSQRSGELQE